MTALQLLIQQLLGRQQSSSYGYPYSTVQPQYPTYPQYPQYQYPQYPQYPQQQYPGSAYIPPITPYYPTNPYGNYPSPVTTYPPIQTGAQTPPAYPGSYIGQVVQTGVYPYNATYTWNGSMWTTNYSSIGGAYAVVAGGAPASGSSPSPLYGSAAAAVCEMAGGTYYGSSGQCGYPNGHMGTWNGSAFV